MKQNNNDDFSVDDLLSGLFKPKQNLRELFEQRTEELGISQTNARELLQMSYRSLFGILDGTQKLVDYTNIIKIAAFLQMDKADVVSLYMESLEKNHQEIELISSDKIKFIKENFDLARLKRAGFIGSIIDFRHIEDRITSFVGLKSIFEYRPPSSDVAFSAGKIQPKNQQTRQFWIKCARTAFEEIDNPYPYNRKGLVELFPEIRWHSTNVKLGLLNIVRELFHLGVTVIYQTPLPSLHLRGATFAVKGKPCIVLTDYKGFYPTLWFSLVHELFHVLFDWEEIVNNQYHISDPDDDKLTVIEKEEEANHFAREYLFSKEKTEIARKNRFDPEFIRKFALTNHVHPSFYYVFSAYDSGKNASKAWAAANKNNPGTKESVQFFENPWDDPKPIAEFITLKKKNLYR